MLKEENIRGSEKEYDSLDQIRPQLLAFGIPKDLIHDFGDGSLSLLNNKGQGVVYKTDDDKFKFTGFPEGYLETIRNEVKSLTPKELEDYISSLTGAIVTKIESAIATETSEKEPFEQRVANFLKENKITVALASKRDGTESLGFTKWEQNRESLDLGFISYEIGTKNIDSFDFENSKKQHQLEGFVTNVIRPMTVLLKQKNCDYLDDVFDLIQEASDEIAQELSY